MKPVAEVTACVVDHGLFLPIALRLARDFKKVYYWTPYEKAFPTVKDFIGDGFSDISRIASPWAVKEECDLFVFPDVGFADDQVELLGQDKPVWGARAGDALELNRGRFLAAVEQAGLPVAPHETVRGVTALKEYLHDQEDKWIKVSRFRGDFETMHWRSWAEDQRRIDSLALRLGPYADSLLFYVFDPIDTEIEDGCDSWCIGGSYPDLVIHGMEAKDKGYIGAWQPYKDLPDPLRRVSEAFAPILAAEDYRSFFSTEVRITKEKEAFFIDPTCRGGSPPSQVMTEMIGNYGQIIWEGANGVCVQPEPAAKFGVQALVTLQGDPREWRALAVNPDTERWLKCPNAFANGDTWWFRPDPEADGKDIGWLVGIGDRLDEAIRHLQYNAKQLPEGACCEYSALADLIKEIQSAERKGMEFTPQPVPEPEIVLEDK